MFSGVIERDRDMKWVKDPSVGIACNMTGFLK